MPNFMMQDPCRIIDAEGDEDDDRRIYLQTMLAARPPTPKVMSRRSVPKIPDWDPILNEERHARTFGRRKTAPSFEHAPSDHKPIFSGPPSLKSSYGSLSGLNNGDKTVINYTPDTPPVTPLPNTSDFDPISLIQENLCQFISTCIPKDYPTFIRCCLRRDRAGVQKGFFPTFYLHIERPGDGKKFFLLAARKVAKVNRQVEYLITTNPETLSDKSGGDGYVGKLRGNNVTGTEYTLYDNGISPNKRSHSQKSLRRELAGIVYNTNLLGFKGPRQINAVLPELGHDIQPTKNEDSILDQWHNRRLNYLLQLRNRSPTYNEQTKTHMLQFNDNRVSQTSVKNFQMIIENENHEEEVVMQYGREDKDTFACDFRYPLSPIQAFGIALSSFDSGIVRE